MTQTLEQQHGIVHGDIDRLTKQRDVLQAEITKMGEQINNLYNERSQAAQKNEAERLEIEAKNKAILETKYEIENLKKELERKTFEFNQKTAKDHELIKQLKDEIRIETARLERIRFESDKSTDEALKRIKEATDADFNLKVKERELVIKEKEIVENLEKSELAKNEVETLKVNLKQKIQECESTLKSLEEKRTNLELDFEKRKGKLDAKEKELSAERENFTKSVKEKEYSMIKREEILKNQEIDFLAREKEFEVRLAQSQEPKKKAKK